VIGGGDGDVTGSAPDLMAWTSAANAGCVWLAARPEELASRPLDAASVRAMVGVMVVRAVHDEEGRARIARRVTALRRASERGTAGRVRGPAPAWTARADAEDRALLLVLLAALRDAAEEAAP